MVKKILLVILLSASALSISAMGVLNKTGEQVDFSIRLSRYPVSGAVSALLDLPIDSSSNCCRFLLPDDHIAYPALRPGVYCIHAVTLFGTLDKEAYLCDNVLILFEDEIAVIYQEDPVALEEEPEWV